LKDLANVKQIKQFFLFVSSEERSLFSNVATKTKKYCTRYV